jgi:hypothetical protein
MSQRTRYCYETPADGRCEFKTKTTAIKHAERAGAEVIFTWAGYIVWRNPRTGGAGSPVSHWGKPEPKKGIP